MLLATACGGKKTEDKPRGVRGKPERVETLAAFMVENVPRPGVVPECKNEDFIGGYPLTHLSLLKLGKKGYKADNPEYADWINPAELDAPAVRVLLDPKSSLDDKQFAAGDFIHAKFFVVYRVENVDAPIALLVKDPKISTIGTRITKYSNTPPTDTIPICASVFHFQSSKEKSEWAIEKSDKTLIDPAVAQVVRDELAARFLELAPRVTAKPASPSPSPH